MIHRLILVVPFACLCAACLVRTGTAIQGAGESVEVSLPAIDCSAPIPGSELIEEGSLTLFGEIHGTAQMPAFIGDLACLLVQRGAVTVALEMPTQEQVAVDAYLASAGTPADVETLLKGSFWQRPMDQQDGRSSLAMAGLLEKLRVLHASGADLKVLAFDAYAPPKPRDESMANNIEQAIRADAARTYVVYSGNVHARTILGAPWNSAYMPLGKYLLDTFHSVRSFNVAYQSGTAWICVDVGCGITPMTGADASAERRLELLTAPQTGGFAGLYHVGPIVASPPAAGSY
ncbi:MAG: hypothetical protein K1X64_10570 [Myxococcaceae bacterium]|nr:hypothetical protein [Myxococcaceae bacterium]